MKQKFSATRNETAYVMLMGSIDARTTQAFAEIIAQDIPSNTRTLYILFSTGGGSVTYAFAIYHLLKSLPYKVIVHNIGSVDSVGNIIFLAGEERYATACATFLLRRPSRDKPPEKEKDAWTEYKSHIAGEEKKIRTIFSKYTKITPTEMTSFFKAGQLKNASYAKRKKMIHDIRDFQLPDTIPLYVVNAPSHK